MTMTFNKVKKKVLDVMLDNDPQDLDEISKEMASVKNYRDLTNLLDDYGFGPWAAGKFIFDAITS